MSSLIFSLNVTMPVFLTMAAGWIFGKMGLLKKEFCAVSDKLVFRVALPCKLFLDMVSVDLTSEFDTGYVLLCAAVTTVSIIVIWICAKFLLKDKKITGEFVQAGYRSSAAILGMAFIQNIYGESHMLSLMVIGSVPLFNIFAVLILTLENPGKDSADVFRKLKEAVVQIAFNPIIDGILLGVFAGALGIHLPKIANGVVSNLASLTTPLALLSIGASFEGRKALGRLKETAIVSAIKLFALVGIFAPLAIHLGYRDEKLMAFVIMLGAPTTATCYIMSKNMGHEGVLSSSAIVSTTVLSAVSITFWIYVFRSMGYMAG